MSDSEQTKKTVIEISVIEKDGAVLFDHNGLSFNVLHAWDEFDGGIMAVSRGGKLFVNIFICEFGTHGACTCFCGIGPLKIPNFYEASIQLGPKDFVVGDVLTLTFPKREEFDFDEEIRQDAEIRAMLREEDKKIKDRVEKKRNRKTR